jgi:hypothetical protein
MVEPRRCDGALTETWPGRRFTFHVDFMAADEESALHQAEAYAQGLLHLRGEVDSLTSRVSADGDWLATTTVFCGAPGPAPGDVCLDRTAHAGWHHGPGPSRRWQDEDVPRTPDFLS